MFKKMMSRNRAQTQDCPNATLNVFYKYRSTLSGRRNAHYFFVGIIQYGEKKVHHVRLPLRYFYTDYAHLEMQNGENLWKNRYFSTNISPTFSELVEN